MTHDAKSDPLGSVATIKRLVAAAFDVPVDIMASRHRTRRYAVPRMVAMALVRDLCLGMSYPAIGRLFGKRDHTSVMHAARSIASLVRRGDLVQEDFDALHAQCKAAVVVETARSDVFLKLEAERLVARICDHVRDGLLREVLRDPQAFVARMWSEGHRDRLRPEADAALAAKLKRKFDPPRETGLPARAARDVPVGQSWAFPKTAPRPGARIRALDPDWPVIPDFKTGAAAPVAKESVHDQS